MFSSGRFYQSGGYPQNRSRLLNCAIKTAKRWLYITSDLELGPLVASVKYRNAIKFCACAFG